MDGTKVNSVVSNIKEQIPGSIEKVKGWIIGFIDYILGIAEENPQMGYILMALLVFVALLFGFRFLSRLKNGFSINTLVYLLLFTGTSYVAFSIYTNIYN